MECFLLRREQIISGRSGKYVCRTCVLLYNILRKRHNVWKTPEEWNKHSSRFLMKKKLGGGDQTLPGETLNCWTRHGRRLSQRTWQRWMESIGCAWCAIHWMNWGLR